MYRDRVADDELVEHRVERMPWSPAQVVALVIGAIFVLMGVIALVRAGLEFDRMFSPEVAVADLHHTPLLGLIEVAFGLFLVMAGALPGGARDGMVFLGVVALGFGIVVIVEPDSMHRTLGVHAENGWVYLISGILVVLTAMLAPVFWARDSRAVARTARDEEIVIRR